MFLVAFLRWLLQSYLHFAPPLLALSLLSLTVFIIMLPLYKLGDIIVLRDKRKKSVMQDELDSIKTVPSSTKKYFYTQEIYRRHGYSPLHSLTGLIGLLVQVPFFIAAYYMLHNYHAFKGMSVGIFTDLFAPDSLLEFWDIPIHLLPLLMTLLNLLSAYYYTIGDQKRDKLQLIMFPAIFLVLLYQQPVALVFYWTMNNVFSLLKNIWVAKRQGHSLALPFCQSHYWRKTLRLYLNWGEVQRRIFFSILAFASFLCLIYLGYSERDRSLTTMFYQVAMLLWFLLYLSLLAQQHLGKQTGAPNKIKRLKSYGSIVLALGNLALLLVLFYFEYRYFHSSSNDVELKLKLLWRNQMLSFRIISLVVLIASFVFQLCFLLPSISFKAKLSNYLFYQKSSRSKFPSQYLYAVLVILLAICVVSPLRTISSDPSQLGNSSPLYIGLKLLLVATIASFAALLLYWFLPRILKNYAVYFSTFLALFVGLNVLFFPGDYGAMEFTSFKQNLEITNQHIAASLLLFFACLLYSSFLKKPQLLAWVLALEVLVAGKYTWTTFNNLQDLAQGGIQKTTQSSLDTTVKPIRLSRTHNNVIILMLDKFMGGYVPSILEVDPELAKEFEGFVYYPNTVSQANVTYGGFHPMLGGAEYTVDKMNQNQHSLAADILDAYTLIPEALAPLGYETSFIDVKPSLAYDALAEFPRELQAHGIEDYHTTTLNYDLLPNPEVLSNSETLEIRWDKFFALLGLFQGLGPTFRKKIYSSGRWLNQIGDAETWASLAFFDPYLKLLSMTQLSELRDDERGSYILLHSNLPHNTTFPSAYEYYANPAYFSYPLPEVPAEFVEFDKKHNWQDKRTQALFYANYHSLRLVAMWLKWLREQGVYDNSIIYLTSDHGSSNFDPSFLDQQDSDERLKIKASFHSLYMHKMLESRGALQVFNNFRTMADIPFEFLPSLGVQNNPHSGKKLSPVTTEPIPLYVLTGMGQNEKLIHIDSQYYIREQYWLKNRNIFEDANWLEEPGK